MKKRLRIRLIVMGAAVLSLMGCGETNHLTVDSHVESAAETDSDNDTGTAENGADIVYSNQSSRPVPDSISMDEFNSKLDELDFWKNEDLSMDTDDAVVLDAATSVEIFHALTEYGYAEAERRLYGDGLGAEYYRLDAGWDSDGNELDSVGMAYDKFEYYTRDCQSYQEFDDAHHYASFVDGDGNNTVVVHAYDVVICVSSQAHDLVACEAVMDYLVCGGEAPELVRYPVTVQIITSEE